MELSSCPISSAESTDPHYVSVRAPNEPDSSARHDLADNEPVEENLDGGQLLLTVGFEAMVPCCSI